MHTAKRVLPIEQVLGIPEWGQLKYFAEKISLPIVIDLYWQHTNDDKLATLLRIALPEFLALHGIDRPSLIDPHRHKFPFSELIFFLRDICIPSVIDMSAAFEASKDVDIERRAICRLLSILDPKNAHKYGEEEISITNRITIQEGLKVVDSSRIHVDTGALAKWAERELSDAFSRYLALVQAGIGIAEDYDTVLRLLTRTEITEKQYLEVPKNEADDILVAIVTRLKEQFLLDKAHGLDSYLSKRVRHGSISNYLRGPVEEYRLITQKETREPTEQSYRENTFWLNKLNGLTSDGRDEASRVFKKFAAEFDSLIFRLKDEVLHIRSVEFPKGVFDIVLTSNFIHIIRSLIQVNPSLSALSQMSFMSFWRLLDPSLKKVESLLLEEVASSVSEAFARFRHEITEVVFYDPNFSELSTAIGSASQKVHNQLSIVADCPSSEILRH